MSSLSERLILVFVIFGLSSLLIGVFGSFFFSLDRSVVGNTFFSLGIGLFLAMFVAATVIHYLASK